MFSSEYSPFNQTTQFHTANRDTTSHKKYPANKYDDPIDLKHQLFNHHQSTNLPKPNPQPVFFQNTQLHQSLYGSQPDSIIETPNYLVPKKYNPIDDYTLLVSQYAKTPNPTKQKHKKSLNNQKSKKLRSKSCQFSAKQTKKTNPLQQNQQELQMYKQLCLTLRKQNEHLESKIYKQQKQQSKFNSQVQKLKDKIKKMYDHCIQKNKSSKNVDLDLKHLIKKHTHKENNFKSSNKGNQSSIFGSKTFCGNKKTIKQTIDTARTSKRDLNTESFRETHNLKNKVPKNIQFVESQMKESLNSYKNTQNEFSKKSSRFPQYDSDHSDAENNPLQTLNPDDKSQYKEFFQTFIKSLDIFQSGSSPEHRLKTRHLKQAGYQVQWAKQEWLEIVEYLIQKGYTSGTSLKKTKRAEATIKSIR